MKIIDTAISDVKIIEPAVFGDERGFFMESFNLSKFNDAIGYEVNFVQDNHSKSSRGVLRGLHYQLAPYAQGKLVRVTQGEVFDVAVDLRPDSTTCGKWVGVIISAENKKQLWIPEGFAHGFCVISQSADFLYKTTNYWNKESERSIIWNDDDIAVKWPDGLDYILSEKDSQATTFKKALAEIYHTR